MRLLIITLFVATLPTSWAMSNSEAVERLQSYSKKLQESQLDLHQDLFSSPTDHIFRIRFNLNSEVRNQMVKRLIFLTHQNFKGGSYKRFLQTNLLKVQPNVESYTSVKLQQLCENISNALNNSQLDNELLLKKLFSYLNQLDIKDYSNINSHFTPFDYIAEDTGVNVRATSKSNVGELLEEKIKKIERRSAPQILKIKAKDLSNKKAPKQSL